MVQATYLRDVEKSFLNCPICHRQLKNPRIFPCLHRVCDHCLTRKVKLLDDGKTIKCPVCQEYSKAPVEGVIGLERDLATADILEFISLVNSIKEKPMRTCHSCNKKLNMTAFCYKCHGFLCQSCNEVHGSDPSKDAHRLHILNLEDVWTGEMTSAQLASLMEPPTCQSHPEYPSVLCCVTCNNMPICALCVYAEWPHRSHTLMVVMSYAESARKRLAEKIEGMMQFRQDIHQCRAEIEGIKEKFKQTVMKKKAILQNEFKLKQDKIGRKIRNSDEKLAREKTKLQEKLVRKISRNKKRMERARRTPEQFEEFYREEKQKSDAKFDKCHHLIEQRKGRLQMKLADATKQYEAALALGQTEQKRVKRGLERRKHEFVNIRKRFENITMTSTSVLTAEHDWRDVQFIASLCKAIENVIRTVKDESRKLKAHCCYQSESVTANGGENGTPLVSKSLSNPGGITATLLGSPGLNTNTRDLNTRESLEELLDDDEDVILLRVARPDQTSPTHGAQRLFNDGDIMSLHPDRAVTIITPAGNISLSDGNDLPQHPDRRVRVPSQVIQEICIRINARSKTVDIKGIRLGDIACYIRDIAANRYGSISITGGQRDGPSQISLTNLQGDYISKKMMKSASHGGWCYCVFLSTYRIVTCMDSEIGIYDVLTRSYGKTKIHDLTYSWPKNQLVTGVTVDHYNNVIIVGGFRCKDLFIFDDDLKFIATVALPGIIEYPAAMTVHRRNLLVCDAPGKGMYAITREGSSSRVEYEFARPDLDDRDWKPIDVCTDTHGFVYALWAASTSNRYILVQYSQDGHRILQAIPVKSEDAISCITTAHTRQGEKLLLATLQTSKLIVYNLYRRR